MLTEKQINDFAKKLTEMRGTIVHGGEHSALSLEDCQLINLFEVIIYAQMLDRAGITPADIKPIISSALFHHDLFNKAMETLDSNNQES